MLQKRPLVSLRLRRSLPGRNLPRITYRTWDTPTETPRHFIAVGDLQRTALIERVIARRQNDPVRREIMKAIHREQPEFLLLLGDQVADGSTPRDWEYFNMLVAPIRQDNIPLYALMGNHDYGSDFRKSRRNFFAHFAQQERDPPQILRLGDIAFVALDSNFRVWKREAMQRQTELYKAALDHLDGDPTVRLIIVGAHNPPFTNSRLKTDRRLIDLFAQPFIDSKKGRLFLSAHVHSYERFREAEKFFVVSGGGGGPRRRVDISENRLCQNDMYSEGFLRPFHYLRMTMEQDALLVEAVMFQEPGRNRWHLADPEDIRFAVGDSFRVPM